ncbi:MAG: HlyC/CorC family transporter [Acidimicrobiia bacterium]|nr:HlyC/CorC family transporter [Acidimicrobiia bacterium]
MSVGPLLAMVALLVLNGFFVAAEFAFTAASKHQLSAMTSRSARSAVKAIDELSFSLAGAQLGITIASLLLGAVAEPAVASIIEGLLGSFVTLSDDALHTIALIVSLLIVVFLHMVVGEMGPKNIAIAAPERSSLLMAIPFRAYSTVFRPVIGFLNGIANVMLRMVGIDPTDAKEAHTADDLATLITAGRREGVVEDFAHRLLTGAIDLWDLRAEDVMVPRIDMVAVAHTSTVEDIEVVVIESGYSRLPVYGETMDDIKGFVHAKDLLGFEGDEAAHRLPSDVIRPLLAVPESIGVGDLLERMREHRNHLVLVVDEHGGTAGIVTLEDIVEEVVGEIRDEHDTELDGVRQLSANRYAIDASLRPDEIERAIGIRLPEGDYETIAGLLLERIGVIPKIGDRVALDEWILQVRAMDGHRLTQVDLIARKSRGGAHTSESSS